MVKIRQISTNIYKAEQNKFTVIHMDIQYLINIRINSIWHTQDCIPTFVPPCINCKDIVKWIFASIQSFNIQYSNIRFKWLRTYLECRFCSVLQTSSSNIKGQALPFAGNSMGYYKQSMVSVLKLFLMYNILISPLKN